MIEISPEYVDTIIRRWERLTSEQAVLHETGRSTQRSRANGACQPSTSTGTSDDQSRLFGRLRKPPKHSQFKPGQSGNPRGKAKGRKNLTTELLEELSERVVVTENGRQRKLSKQTIILKRMVTDAAQGDARPVISS